jgi:uncharacterized protein YutE (UPF0331/DUF86 family)
MKNIPVSKSTILGKLDEIQKDISKLNEISKLTLEEFKSGENFAITEHYLRRALEALFEISAHILSRIPGKRPSGYKDIAKLLGETGIVPDNYAKETLIKMAGYRNRLVHFYSEITKDEMYEIIKNRLKDFDIFTEHIKIFLISPGKFDLTIEE